MAETEGALPSLCAWVCGAICRSTLSRALSRVVGLAQKSEQ